VREIASLVAVCIFVTFGFLVQPASAADPVVRDIQTLLNFMGYDAGPEDGLSGSRTEQAAKQFYADRNLMFDGSYDNVDAEVMRQASSD